MKIAPNVSLILNVQIPMRDGTLLYADVYLPSITGIFPCLLARTPYDKGQKSITGIDYIRAAEEGYAVVVQDVRGRFASEGEFYPFLQESADGYDSVEWIAKQSWSNGNIGMVGGSYLGAAQWLAAITYPPHLKALFPAITPSDYNEGWVFRGGAFQLGFCLSWTLESLVIANLPHLLPQQLISERLKDLNNLASHMDKAFTHLPINELPYFVNGIAPYYYDWINKSDNQRYWKRWSIEDHYQSIITPTYHLGGWYDIFIAGTLHNFTGLKNVDLAPQKLLVGPWAHTSPLENPIGEIDFGNNSSAQNIDLDGIQLRWFNYWLKGISNGIMQEPAVSIFIMGENIWRNEDSWPLRRAIETHYYLHSKGNANGKNGDGSLDTNCPGNESLDRFHFDPENPVPTLGGGLCCNPVFLANGPYDQQILEDRTDILVYTSKEFEEETEITGPISFTLWASSSKRHTDFTAKLVDVHPNGKAYNLADGIIRSKYRESRFFPSALNPGKPYQFTIDLGATSNLFKIGHRIRLEVSSSNFPKFDRNTEGDRDGQSEDRQIIAIQRILHNSEYPSYLSLPIIPRHPK